jgi:excisionase family DNA binding protein
VGKLLTILQLSDLLQIKPSTIYKWVHYHYIPFVKLGSSVRFREKKIEGWLQKRERKGRISYKIQIEG